MAIGLNNVSSTNVNASSATFGHDANGSDILMVYVGAKNSTFPFVDTITFNTTSDVILCTGAIFGSTQLGEMWYLESPPQVSGNVVVTTFASTKFTAGAVSYTNVSGINTNNVSLTLAQDTTPTGTITTEVANSIVVRAYSQRDASHTPTMDSNYVNRYTEETPGNPAGNQTEGRGLDRGVGAGLTAGAYSFSDSIGATEAWVVIQAELVATAGLTPIITSYGTFY